MLIDGKLRLNNLDYSAGIGTILTGHQDNASRMFEVNARYKAF